MKNQKQQTALIKPISVQPTHAVEYVPPAPEAIEQYVLTVCQKLGEHLDSAYDTTDVRDELTGLLKTVASICVSEVNRKNQALTNRPPPDP